MKKFRNRFLFAALPALILTLCMACGGSSAQEDAAKAGREAALTEAPAQGDTDGMTVIADELDAEGQSSQDSYETGQADEEEEPYLLDGEGSLVMAEEELQEALSDNEETDSAGSRETDVSGDEALAQGEEASGDEAPAQDAETSENDPAEDGSSVTEDGEYTSKEEVALYLHLYGHLPSNFITKKEAQNLGWSGGSLEDYAPGKSIGGSNFGNYEGLLPEKKGRRYYECDIDYDGKRRGAKRIVWSSDGLIFYTEDHYNSFEQLY